MCSRSCATMNTVHPRVCGERRLDTPDRRVRIGSSPRVRGTGRHRRAGRVVLRFIPACAGNGPSPARRSGRSTVHPRVCGERCEADALKRKIRGSSPRVRGTALVGRFCGTERRFIPACAGNGVFSANAYTSNPVHPRVCGERPADVRGGDLAAGSSPRVRGTGVGLGALAGLGRFIPACAGNGRTAFGVRASKPVHPRVCGERSALTDARRASGGSSPRVRGTEPHSQSNRAIRRFIPACAGNGATRRPPTPGAAVHPRVCGERAFNCLTSPSSFGSSPRVRGTAGVPRPARPGLRFIPACAGNGPMRASNTNSAPVHPRVCGERGVPPPTRASASGSSPRVRGTAYWRRRGEAWGRFIPACAGNG